MADRSYNSVSTAVLHCDDVSQLVFNCEHSQGRSDGGRPISVYIPSKSVYLTNFYVVTGCFFLFDSGQIVVDFEIGMTS